MAGNAKQYNDLNSTKVVNSADKVALAQENQAELVTTTVGDLANAVGELNQAGALAELSLATSIGKNLLAQRLNEKGVECAPTDTLVYMADKVNSLVIDGQKTALIGKLITAVENTYNSKHYTFQYCNAKKGQMGDVIILDQAANTLSYVRNGDYNTVDAAILAATSTINLPAASNTSRMRALGISQNERFLITDIDDNKLHIYEINKVAGTLTLKHDITTTATILAGAYQGQGGSLQSLSVTNDGDKYVFWNAQGGTTIGSVSLAKELNASWSSDYNQLFFIEGTDFVGIAPGSQFGYSKIKYDFDTETVQTFQGLSGQVGTAFFEPRSQLLVSSQIENENTSTSIQNMGMFHRITLYSPENMLSVFSARVQNICAFYGGATTASASVTGVQFQVADIGDGNFSWICPIYGEAGVLEYNKNTGAFSVNDTVGLKDSRALDPSGTDGRIGGLMVFAKNGGALRLDTDNEGFCSYGMAIYFSYQRHFTFTDKDCFLGVMQKSASTGKTGVFNMRCEDLSVLPDLLATGVLDVDTPSVEI